MNSLFSEKTIASIKNIRKTFLWAAVFILIGEVVVGAVLILAESFNEVIGRLMLTFALCAIVLFVGVNNFSRMEKGDRLVQGFALVSLITNLIWLLIAILMIWEVTAFYETTQVQSTILSSRVTSKTGLTVMAKIMIAALDVATACFWISNVWSIKETVKPVRPLKITALVCELYCGIYAVVITLGDLQNVTDVKWNTLAGLAALAFIVMASAALIVSRNGEKKNANTESVGGMDNAEMQNKIQEMVEKEVQARMAMQGGTGAQNAPVDTAPASSGMQEVVVDSAQNDSAGVAPTSSEGQTASIGDAQIVGHGAPLQAPTSSEGGVSAVSESGGLTNPEGGSVANPEVGNVMNPGSGDVTNPGSGAQAQ